MHCLVYGILSQATWNVWRQDWQLCLVQLCYYLKSYIHSQELWKVPWWLFLIDNLTKTYNHWGGKSQCKTVHACEGHLNCCGKAQPFWWHHSLDLGVGLHKKKESELSTECMMYHFTPFWFLTVSVQGSVVSGSCHCAAPIILDHILELWAKISPFPLNYVFHNILSQ